MKIASFLKSPLAPLAQTLAQTGMMGTDINAKAVAPGRAGRALFKRGDKGGFFPFEKGGTSKSPFIKGGFLMLAQCDFDGALQTFP